MRPLHRIFHRTPYTEQSTANGPNDALQRIVCPLEGPAYGTANFQTRQPTYKDAAKHHMRRAMPVPHEVLPSLTACDCLAGN